MPKFGWSPQSKDRESLKSPVEPGPAFWNTEEPPPSEEAINQAGNMQKNCEPHSSPSETGNLGFWKLPFWVVPQYVGKAMPQIIPKITINCCYKPLQQYGLFTIALLTKHFFLVLGVWWSVPCPYLDSTCSIMREVVRDMTEFAIIYQPEMKSFCEGSPYWTSLRSRSFWRPVRDSWSFTGEHAWTSTESAIAVCLKKWCLESSWISALIWVKQRHQPPSQSLFFIGGMVTIPSHRWFMALFVLSQPQPSPSQPSQAPAIARGDSALPCGNVLYATSRFVDIQGCPG